MRRPAIAGAAFSSAFNLLLYVVRQLAVPDVPALLQHLPRSLVVVFHERSCNEHAHPVADSLHLIQKGGGDAAPPEIRVNAEAVSPNLAPVMSAQYDAGDPAVARVNVFIELWLGSLALGGFGLLCLGIGFGTLLYERRRMKTGAENTLPA